MRPQSIILIACVKVYARRQKMPMKAIARQYLCHFCHKKVTVCHACDRGHVYCGIKCSQIARHVSLKTAGKKYQNNQAGKLKHAERQKRYRIRNKKIVTHHSSNLLLTYDLLPPTLDKTRNTENKIITSDNRCHFCGNNINKGGDDGTH